MNSRKRRRPAFVPACDQLEGRMMLDAAIHAIGSSGHHDSSIYRPLGTYAQAGFRIAGRGSVDLNGQLAGHLPTIDSQDLRVLNVAVGSMVSLFSDVYARSPIDHSSEAHFASIAYSIDGGTFVSAKAADTSYTFDEGKYLRQTSEVHTSFVPGTGLSGYYNSTMGTDLSYIPTPDRYDVDFFSFFVGPAPGTEHVKIDATYTSGAIDHMVFNLNVVSPQASLTSTLGTDSFRWGPALQSSSLEGGANAVTEFTAVDWNDFDYTTLDPYPEFGVQRNYIFGGMSPGLYPDRFTGTATNVTPTPGKFYVVQLAAVRPSSTEIYDANTGRTTIWKVESAQDGEGGRLYGLDAFPKEIDAQWAMGGIVDQQVRAANSGQSDVPDPNSIQGYNNTSVSFYYDSPKAAIPTTTNTGPGSMQAGRNYLLQSDEYHLDLRTYLVFQATDANGFFVGIPVALLEKDWHVDISMTNVNPVLSWENSYTVEANWQGTATLTAGGAITDPQLLKWNYNVPSLVDHPIGTVLSAATVESFDPSLGAGNSWTFSGPSGVGYVWPAGDSAYLYSGSNPGSMTQSVTFPWTGQYTLSFDASQYDGYDPSWAPAASFAVKLDGVTVGTFTPSTAYFAPYSTAPFTATEGVHTIRLVSTTAQSNLYNYVRAFSLSSTTTPATGGSPATFVATSKTGDLRVGPLPMGDLHGREMRQPGPESGQETRGGWWRGQRGLGEEAHEDVGRRRGLYQARAVRRPLQLSE